ncbi:MAG: bifunctional demethylmenaquinone methyltransferase/2-methoxy-6-polyprenyl-1,4-benzoquinol methylase UbiE [Muribaculaceae bacterium]|nr:bifunctional demethylmenaquinone methyltransferase/2-methoxy-6-polyprenyl-1,4-benzoquinol methylase UbiE [Muribaculaceae bacterium]
MGAERVKPYSDNDPKGRQVEQMFDNIAPAYDLMNKAMTLGLHTRWRDRALSMALSRLRAGGITTSRPDVLDVATGTGDLVFSLHRRLPAAHITGIDLSEGMLNIAERKLHHLEADEQSLLSFCKGDCLQLPFEDNSFDMVTVAYGVRNFEDLPAGYREMARVLRPGGVLCVVELSVPTATLTRGLYKLYTRHIIPTVGRMVSGDSRAYTYLPESIAAVPQRGDMTRLMQEAGLTDTLWRPLTFGTVTIYIATKPIPRPVSNNGSDPCR